MVTMVKGEVEELLISLETEGIHPDSQNDYYRSVILDAEQVNDVVMTIATGAPVGQTTRSLKLVQIVNFYTRVKIYYVSRLTGKPHGLTPTQLQQIVDWRLQLYAKVPEQLEAIRAYAHHAQLIIAERIFSHNGHTYYRVLSNPVLGSQVSTEGVVYPRDAPVITPQMSLPFLELILRYLDDHSETQSHSVESLSQSLDRGLDKILQAGHFSTD